MWSNIAILAASISIAQCGNILIIPSQVSPSHKMGMLPLADALAERGHEVLFWSAVVNKNDKYIPKKAPYKQPLGETDNQWLNDVFVHMNDTTTAKLPWTLDISVPGYETVIFYQVLPYCESILRNKKEEIADVVSKKWDVIIVDELFNPCGYLLANFIDAPVITYVSTSCQFRTSVYRNGQPAPASYVPICAMFTGYTSRMSFLQRSHNFLLWTLARWVDASCLKLSTWGLKEFYPQLNDLSAPMEKTDLTFFYFHSVIDYPVPMNPNLIHVGGLHTTGLDIKPLPASIAAAIEKGSKGFIMVATGHLAKFEYASPETKEAFINAFNRTAKNGYAVVWQYDGDAHTSVEDGVSRFQWLPQKELLTHPKIKAFLSHSGCNSILEALQNGVPVIGLGLIADQVTGASLLQYKGVSVRLDKMKLTADIIYDSVIEVATNTSIHTRAKMFAEIIKNDQMQPMDKAIFWTEYVLRHKGAKWLRTRIPPGFSSFVKYYCLDVIIVMLAISFSFLYITFKVVQMFWRLTIGEKGIK